MGVVAGADDQRMRPAAVEHRVEVGADRCALRRPSFSATTASRAGLSVAQPDELPPLAAGRRHVPAPGAGAAVAGADDGEPTLVGVQDEVHCQRSNSVGYYFAAAAAVKRDGHRRTMALPTTADAEPPAGARATRSAPSATSWSPRARSSSSTASTARGSTGSPSGPAPTSGCSITTSATRRRSTRGCCSRPTARSARARRRCTSASCRRAQAMEKLVGFTFDHFRRHPWFLRLLATENIQRGRLHRARCRRSARCTRRWSPRSARCSRPARRGHLPRRGRSGAALHHHRRHQLFLHVEHPHPLGDLRHAPRRRGRRWRRAARTASPSCSATCGRGWFAPEARSVRILLRGQGKSDRLFA